MKKCLKRLLLVLVVAAVAFSCPGVVSAKSYLSLRKVGLAGKFKAYSQKYCILSVKGNTVRYCTVKIVPTEDDFDIKHGKTKKAKLTSKTKYYLGDVGVYSSDQNRSFNDKKWIYKVKKSTFVKYVNGYQWWDYIIVKNGKVQKIFTNMQLAS